MFKALLVDDNLNFRSALHEALHSRFPFCDLVSADGVQSALRKVARLRPDLVITDLMMPDGNGFDLIRRLRAMKVTARIVVLTIHDLPEYREEAVRSGADEFFTKLSTSVQDIFGYIEGLLDQRLRALVVCGEPSLNNVIGALLAARCADVVTARTFGLEDGVQTGRLLKPHVVLLHAEDDAGRERLYGETLTIGLRGTSMRLVCVRSRPVASDTPSGSEFVVSRGVDFEDQVVRIVDLVRAEQSPGRAAT